MPIYTIRGKEKSSIIRETDESIESKLREISYDKHIR